MSEKDLYANMPTGWYVPGTVDPAIVPQAGPIEQEGIDLSPEQLRRSIEMGLAKRVERLASVNGLQESD